MSESKHTLGDWKSAEPRHPGEQQEEDRLIYALVDGKQLHVAKVYQYQNDDNCDANGTALANAALIVAAPVLLLACEAMVHAAKHNDSTAGDITAILAFGLAEAAIAKATEEVKP